MSKSKEYTLRFFQELEKEIKFLVKKNQDDALVLQRIVSLKNQHYEFALEDILEQLERHPFLKIKPQTMEWANIAISWPPTRNQR